MYDFDSDPVCGCGGGSTYGGDETPEPAALAEPPDELAPWPEGWEPDMPEYVAMGEDPPVQVGDVIVTAGRSSLGGAPFSGRWSQWDTNSWDTSVECPNYVKPPRPEGWDDEFDHEIDSLAVQIANEINALPIAQTMERGALIYIDSNGDLQRTALIMGDNQRLTGLNQNSVPSDFGLTSWSQVVGYIHSHPRYIENPPQSGIWIDSTQSQYSSSGFDLPSTGDWSWPDLFAQNNTNANMFRQYLLYNSNLKEFSLYNNPLLTNETARRSALQLAENDYGC